jgi:hypothetical protein
VVSFLGRITIMAVQTPSDLLCIDAHKHSARHRVELEASTRCACFFCFRTFPTASIKVWIDSNQTALCPACGVDSVIGSASEHRLDDAFLRLMHQHFFAQRSKMMR